MSLKKVASTQPSHRTIEVPTELPMNLQDSQATDSIQLSVIKKQQVQYPSTPEVPSVRRVLP